MTERIPFDQDAMQRALDASIKERNEAFEEILRELRKPIVRTVDWGVVALVVVMFIAVVAVMVLR